VSEELPGGVFHCFLENDRDDFQVETRGTLATVLGWALHEQHADEIRLWNDVNRTFDLLTPDQAERLRLTHPDSEAGRSNGQPPGRTRPDA
jgi:hypothetical protein